VSEPVGRSQAVPAIVTPQREVTSKIE
jgi:hypothetical protein